MAKQATDKHRQFENVSLVVQLSTAEHNAGRVEPGSSSAHMCIAAGLGQHCSQHLQCSEPPSRSSVQRQYEEGWISLVNLPALLNTTHQFDGAGTPSAACPLASPDFPAAPCPRCFLPPDRQGKLCLVLDLDHTLLNSATFAEVGPALHEQLEVRAASEAATLPEDKRLLFRMDAIKVRPASRLGTAVQLGKQLWLGAGLRAALPVECCYQGYRCALITLLLAPPQHVLA